MILAAGAINSPQLLLLLRDRAGGAARRRAGIEVVADLPGVGENLQDHLEIYVQYACKQPITLYGRMDPLSKLRIGADWLLFAARARRHQPLRVGRLHPLRGRR